MRQSQLALPAQDFLPQMQEKPDEWTDRLLGCPGSSGAFQHTSPRLWGRKLDGRAVRDEPDGTTDVPVPEHVILIADLALRTRLEHVVRHESMASCICWFPI